MEALSLSEIFFGTQHHDSVFILLKILILLLVQFVLMWLLFFVLSKVLFKKTEMKSDFRLPIIRLWSIGVFLMLFTLYLLILLSNIALDAVPWSNYQTYLAFFKGQQYSVLPLVLVFLVSCAAFIIYRRRFLKTIK